MNSKKTHVGAGLMVKLEQFWAVREPFQSFDEVIHLQLSKVSALLVVLQENIHLYSYKIAVQVWQLYTLFFFFFVDKWPNRDHDIYVQIFSVELR